MADAAGKFPRPYRTEVKRDDSIMVYTKFENNEIGARPSGMPKDASAGPLSIEHVGQNANTGSKK